MFAVIVAISGLMPIGILYAPQCHAVSNAAYANFWSYLTQTQQSALMHAASFGHLAMVKHLIQKYKCDWQAISKVLMYFYIHLYK